VEEPVSDGRATRRRIEIDDKVPEEPGPSPGGPEQPNSPGAVPPESRRRKRGRLEAQPIVRPLSPRQTRASSKVRSVNPHDAAPAVSQTTPRGKTKSKTSATVVATVPQPIPESQLSDEFVAHSDDEGDMHEVEANLQVSAISSGMSRVTSGCFISP
jgi:hypothetical protein